MELLKIFDKNKIGEISVRFLTKCFSIFIVLLTNSAHSEERISIEDKIAVCESNQHICLQMASHYFSSGDLVRGFKLLGHRAHGGESVDIYNYAYNLKRFNRIEWKHWMGIAAGLGDSTAQIELIQVRPKIRTNGLNQDVFNIYLLATYEDEGVLSCIDVMKTAIRLKKNQFLISALRRSKFFCRPALNGSVAGEELLRLDAEAEKLLTPVAQIAWKKFNSAER